MATSLLPVLRPDKVQRTARLEPFDLRSIVGMVALDRVLRSVLMVEHDGQLLSGSECREIGEVDAFVLPNLRGRGRSQLSEDPSPKPSLSEGVPNTELHQIGEGFIVISGFTDILRGYDCTVVAQVEVQAHGQFIASAYDQRHLGFCEILDRGRAFFRC